MGVAGSLLGCEAKPPSVEEKKTASSTSSTPLRILVVGEDSIAEVLRRGWESVSSTPIRSTTIPFTRGQKPDAVAMSEAAKQSDLIIGPAILAPDLVEAKQILELKGGSLDELSEAVLPSLKLSISQYSDVAYSVPIGAKSPALISSEPLPPLKDWQAYDSFVETKLSGKAAEPTAEGWAGWMFLLRIPRISNRWLFDRENFQALIDHPDNVAALELMKQTVARYPETNLSPTQIFTKVTSGELVAGIGFPSNSGAGASDLLQVSGLPGTDKSTREIIDPFATVIFWSSRCRQSAVAKTFCNWVGGNDGAQQLRDSLPEFSTTRRSVLDNEVGVYEQWLAQRYTSPLSLPTLRIVRGTDYYAALDAAVIECVRGNAKAEPSLKKVAQAWDKITAEVSTEKQIRAWRRNLGLKA
jgi:hypothetical protein